MTNALPAQTVSVLLLLLLLFVCLFIYSLRLLTFEFIQKINKKKG